VTDRRSSSLPAARMTLVLLAAVPAVMAYPWQSPRERWVLGAGAAVVLIASAWWRGRFVTTIVRQRLAMMRRNRDGRHAGPRGLDMRTTALLRVTAPRTQPDLLPLPLIADCLDRYGVRARAVRVTSRDTGSDAGARRQTWIGLTLSAADNLTALRARGPQIPLRETAEVAARRLADHLREIGWTAGLVGQDDLPEFGHTRETWAGVRAGDDCLAAYRVPVDAELPETLAAIAAYPARVRWTALEIADDGAGRSTVAVGCALQTATAPKGAPAGLSPQSGNHGPALAALHPLSTRRLDGHSALPADLLPQLRWSSAAGQPPLIANNSAALR
jgi:type VII secretion protein EccE